MLLWTFVILFLKLSRVVSYVAIQNGIYNNISVGLDKSLQAEDCGSIVDAIKKMFENASGVLATATSGLSFGSIYVIVPSGWNTCGSYTVKKADGYIAYDSSSVRVGGPHPLFGLEPWTNQPSGCGMEGEFISMSSDWLLSSSYSDALRGSRFVHEWAKYRWGVFEEFGHYGDPVYPESFRQSSGSFVPNYCTNSKLNGDFSSDCSSSTDCGFNIADSPAVSSSLMAVPELSSITSFCDDSTHRYDIPSKQNLICNYTSSWTIISKHSDIAQSRFQIRDRRSMEITVLQENLANSLVITYETSHAMEDYLNRFEYLKESIAQFIVYEAPDNAKLGLVSFSEIPKAQTARLRVLDSKSKTELAEKVINSKTSEKSTIDLRSALTTSASLLQKGNGVILLMTRCTGQDPQVEATELASASNGHPVWIILYPTNSTAFLNVYSDLAYLTGGKLLIIEEEVISNPLAGQYVSPIIRMRLSQALRQLLHTIPTYDYRQIKYETCKNLTSCKVTITSPNGFVSPMFVNIYHDVSDKIDSDTSSVEVSGGSCPLDPTSAQTTNVFKCSTTDLMPKFDIDIERRRGLATLVIELVGRPISNNSDYKFQLVGKDNLSGLKYTENSAPVISVKFSSNGTNIVYANLSALITFNQLNNQSKTIYLYDDGTGADITGNDGIYSAFLVPSIPEGDFSVSFKANSNDGRARFLPTTYDSSRSYACCGSVIPLPSELIITPTFNVSSLLTPGDVTDRPTNLDLPPGVIKDFQFSSEGDSYVRYSFTATGEDLTYGTADHYMLKQYENNLQSVTEKKLSFKPKQAGTIESLEETPPCGITNIVSIYAVDRAGLKGDESNRITVYMPCGKSGGMSVGAWVGIGFAILFLVIIFIAFLIYIICYEDNSDNNKGMQKLKQCSCCEEDEQENIYSVANENSSADESYLSPGQPIRNINDLVVNQDKEFELSAEPQNEQVVNIENELKVSEESRPRMHETDLDDERYQEGPPEYVLEDITYLVKLSHTKRTSSERSLQSAKTASPFASTHSMNNVGIPYSCPSSSASDYKTIPMSKSYDSLYNTQV